MEGIIPGLTPVLRQTFQDFGLFQGRFWIFLGDLPYFEGFSRKVIAFLWRPSRISGFFKEGLGFLLGTFLISKAFQGWSLRFCWDLPGFRPFSRKVLSFLSGPSRISGFFKEGPGFSLETFQDFRHFQGRSAGFVVF